MYFVMWEFDGYKAASRHYQRLHRMGLYVRGDKDESPIARRIVRGNRTVYDDHGNAVEIEANSAVIAQEATVICASESLARAVAAVATREGAVMVKMGQIDFDLEDTTFVISAKDQEYLDQIDEVYGKRGRPSPDKYDFVVTCHEQATSYLIKDVRDVANCPVCHGLKINKRVVEHGEYIPSFRSVLSGDDIINYWIGTRFSREVFEVPDAGLADPPSLEAVNLTEDNEIEAVKKIVSSSVVDGLTPDDALSVLDGLLCSLAYFDANDRMDARLRAISRAFQMGADPTKITLSPLNKVDIFEAAPILREHETARIFLSKKGTQ